MSIDDVVYQTPTLSSPTSTELKMQEWSAPTYDDRDDWTADAPQLILVIM